MASILIVEDDQMLRDVFGYILSQAGHSVYAAGEGIEGLRQLKRLRPDIILLDYMMPLMDGREFMRNVDSEEYPDTKVVVYTNMSEQGIETEMKELGAHSVVLKSAMDPNRLLDLIRSLE